MQKHLSVIAAVFLYSAIFSSVSAEKTYKATVKADPPHQNLQVSIFTSNGKFEKTIKGFSGTFSVPAGTYSVSVDQSSDYNGLKFMDFSSKKIKVASNMTVIVPLRTIRAVSIKAKLEFERMLVLTDGSREKCPFPAKVDQICGISPNDIDTLKEFVESYKFYDSNSDWLHLTPDMYSSTIVIDRERYSFTIIEGSRGSYLSWSRLEK